MIWRKLVDESWYLKSWCVTPLGPAPYTDWRVFYGEKEFLYEFGCWPLNEAKLLVEKKIEDSESYLLIRKSP